jgi:hypothetical protein
MTSDKKPIVVVGGDENIINLLSYMYDINKVISYDDYIKHLVEVKRGNIKKDAPVDLVIFSGDIEEDQFAFPPVEEVKPDKLTTTLSSIFNIVRDNYFHPPKCIGFGKGALLLAKLNRASLLYDISNHVNTVHLNSFCMADGKILEFDVPSNHNHLILPAQRPVFDILAFSTYNNSQSYTHMDGTIFKATRDFIEIEAIKFRPSNSYCFLYDIPSKDNKVLIDLTLQLFKR